MRRVARSVAGFVQRVSIAAVLYSGTASAEAGSSDKAAAEALFDRGVTLLRAGELKEACTKLETSERIDPAVGTLLYLGTCYERLGRTASAWAAFREAGSMARSTGQTDRAEIARERTARLEPELAYLTIMVPTAARVADLSVRRAGSVVEADLYGVSVPMDPGNVKIEASAPGYKSFVTSVTVAPRDHKSLTIPALKSDTTSPPVKPNAPEGASKPSSGVEGSLHVQPGTPARDTGPSAGRVLAYSLAGVGVVGLGIGSYFGIRAIQHNQDAKDQHCSGSSCLEQGGLDSTDKSLEAARASNIAFAAGGGLLALGVVLYIVSPSHSTRTVSLAPMTSRDGAGFLLRGVLE